MSRSLFLALALTVSTLSAVASNADEGRAGAWRRAAQGSPSLNACKKVVSKNPKDAIAQNDLGWAYRQHNNLELAEQHLREAIKLKSDMPQAHSNLSVVLFDKGNYDEAIKEAEQAITLDGNNAIFHVVLGNALSKKGETKKAIEAYKQAVKIKPDYENALYNLGRVLKEDGQTSEAKLALADALKLDPSDNRVLELLDKLEGK